MKTSESPKRKLTFADHFGRWKTRVIFVGWSIFMVLALTLLYPTLKSCYSIVKAQESYYIVSVKDDKASYERTTKRPMEWVSLDQISKRIQGAIISSEDGKFYEHPGYDLDQLTEAIDKSVKARNRKKKKVRGASTITQQLVKNLFLSTDRTLFRKGQEMIMALAIEKHADKKKILETYLNVIEYGKGLYGIGNATQFYFHKKPNQLTAREAAFLAMLLPSPVKYAKSFQKKSLTPFAQKMVESILLKMRQGGYIGEQEHAVQLSAHFSWERTLPTDLSVADVSEEETALDAETI
jgi:monofunctional biosynthetic peptidoglycan transglycosylase